MNHIKLLRPSGYMQMAAQNHYGAPYTNLWCQQPGESSDAYRTDLCELVKTCQFCANCLHKVNVTVTAAWSQSHASLVRQWNCMLVWGMGSLSLPAECSLFTSLQNFSKNSHTNIVEVLKFFRYIFTFFQRLQLCRWILISYIIIKCNWLDSGQSPLISYGCNW